MTIHFVYSVPLAGGLSKSVRRVALFGHRLGANVGWLRPRTGLDTSGWPYRAPYSITKNVYDALQSRFPTILYDWQERVQIAGGDQDILLGHPNPGDANSVWNRSCTHGRFAARIAMFPIHHGMPEINVNLEQYIPQVDAIFGITGPYWYDTWDKSVFAHWKPKIKRVDMAVDIRHFPRVKKRFNPKGQRKFLFIGNTEPCKGTHLLSILFGLAKHHRCIWIGGSGCLANLEFRNSFTVLTADFMARIAAECDFFITMGVSDANPTTVLEAMAWGLPVCCTPQSGYYDMPEINQLSTTDMRHNIELLDRLQQAPEEDLRQQADSARRLVETAYTWDRVTSTVVAELTKIASVKGLV
jgi:glycosyltransferase involved in cell wall biosynthesis